jgi:rare lipoprotein A
MKSLSLWTVICASLLLQACGSSTPYTVDGVPGYSKSGKAKSPYVKLGRAYSIKGETYYPKHEPDYDDTGVASWYGPNFHGKQTANGEIYNQYAMTAAHKTLPLPSVVRVTHRENGRSIIVRVNDRGPYADERIIDLSKKAAQKLDMIGSGIAPVRVEYLPEESASYIALLAQGKRPDQIDFVNDVLRPVQFARERAQPTAAPDATRVETVAVMDLPKKLHVEQPPKKTSFWSMLNPVSEAAAAETPAVKTTRTDSLPPLSAPATSIAPPTAPAGPALSPRSPYDVLELQTHHQPEMIGTIPAAQQAPAPVEMLQQRALPLSQKQAPKAAHGASVYFVQVGAFSNPANVTRLEPLFHDSQIERVTVRTANGAEITRVRVGPIDSRALAEKILVRAHANGMADARLIKE